MTSATSPYLILTSVLIVAQAYGEGYFDQSIYNGRVDANAISSTEQAGGPLGPLTGFIQENLGLTIPSLIIISILLVSAVYLIYRKLKGRR